jgi:hypothetical protein
MQKLEQRKANANAQNKANTAPARATRPPPVTWALRDPDPVVLALGAVAVELVLVLVEERRVPDDVLVPDVVREEETPVGAGAPEKRVLGSWLVHEDVAGIFGW